MAAECIEVRKLLKQEYRRLNLGVEIEERLRGLGSQILRIQDTNFNAAYVKELIGEYKKPINGLTRLNLNDLRKLIFEVKNKTLSHILVNLRIPADSFMNLFNKVRETSSSQSLDVILPRFLTFNIMNAINNLICECSADVFCTCDNSLKFCLKDYLSFHKETKGNHYSIGLLTKIKDHRYEKDCKIFESSTELEKISNEKKYKSLKVSKNIKEIKRQLESNFNLFLEGNTF